MEENTNALAHLEEAGLPANIDEMFDSLEDNVLPELPSGDGLPFVKMSQETGVFTFGADNEEIEPDSKWVLLVGAIRHGYFAWYNGEALDHLVPLTQKKPAIADLPDISAVQTSGPSKGKPGKYEPAVSGQFRCVSGEHRGTTVLFNGTNTGGSGMMRKLLEAVLQARKRPGGYVLPVISFYATKKTGPYNTRYPKYTIHDWWNAKGESRSEAGSVKVTVEDNVQDAEVVEDDGAKASKPAKGRRKLE